MTTMDSMLHLRIGVILGLLISVGCSACGPASKRTEFYTWRENLYCPDHCCTVEEPDECCSCHAVPCWELENVDIQSYCEFTYDRLYIENGGILGQYSLVNITNAHIYEVIHINAQLRRLPENICKYGDTLVKIDLANNNLDDISGVNCLTRLDTFHLDSNKISFITNTTFANMTNLRVLTLTDNRLEKIDPNVFIIGQYNIAKIDLMFNNFTYVDMTNVFRKGVYCVMNLSHSTLNELTNELNFKIDGPLYGPGDVDMRYTELPSFLNVSKVGISFSDMPRYISGTYSIDSTSVVCDCGLYHALKGLGSDIGKYWPDLGFVNFNCTAPEHMIGIDLVAILKENRLDKLTCELQDCPLYGKCHCLDMPDSGKVVVNCTGAGLKAFPDVLPVGHWNNKNIELILANNQITNVPRKDYMSRIVSLDLSGNNIANFDATALDDLADTTPIIMEDQRLSTLIPNFDKKLPRNVVFGATPVKCDCSNLWVGDWVRLNKAEGRLNCQLDDGRILPAERVDEGLLDCNEHVFPLALFAAPIGALIGLVTVASSLLYLFRYDIMIFMSRFRNRKTDAGFSKTIDVGFSFNDDNEDARLFVREYLSPQLTAAGYSIFLPFIDIDPGTDRDTAVMKNFENCRNFIVVLCRSYLTDENTLCEFECIWNKFKQDSCVQVIVVNLDFMQRKDVKIKQLRAFIRSNADFSFRDRKGKLYDRIIERLGSPLKKNNIILRNYPLNVRFNAVDIARYLSQRKGERLENPLNTLRACNYCKRRRCLLHQDQSTLPQPLI